MKLMFKHIIKSILHSPWQSIVILITLALSAMIFACIPPIYDSVIEEREFMAELKYGNADVCVSAGNSDGERYITFSDLEEELPEDTLISGYLSLPLGFEQGTVLGAVTDFRTVGQVFEFYFTDYGEVFDGSINDTVFITEKLALERGLKVGDSFKVTILSIEKTYIVQGISAYPFFGGYDVLLHTDGVLSTLSAVSPLFAVFDAENYPCSTVFLCGDGDKIISALEGFNAELCGVNGGYDTQIVLLMLLAVMFLSVILAGILVGISLEILGKRRLAEARAFRLAGMASRQVILAFCIEILSYILIAGAIGIIFSPILLSSLAESFGYSFPMLSHRAVICCALCELLIGILSGCLFLRSFKNKKEGKIATKFFLLLILLSSATALAIFAPVKRIVIFCSIAAVLWVVLVIFGVKFLCRSFTRITDKTPLTVSLALKNNGRLAEMHNIYRVLGIVLSVSAVLSFSLNYFERRIESASDVLNCEYAVIGVQDGAKEKVEEIIGTERAAYAVFAQGKFSDGRALYILDTESEMISEGILSGLPEFGGAYLPKRVAELYGIEEGDVFLLDISGRSCEFRLSGYCSDRSVFAFADLKSLGLKENILLISSHSSADYLSKVTDSLSTQGAFVSEVSEVLSAYTHFLQIAQDMLQSYIIFLILTSAVGALNLIFVCYARRRGQLSELHTVGMSYRQISVMVLCELLVTFALCSILCVIGGTLLTTLLDSAMRSFGYSLF